MDNHNETVQCAGFLRRWIADDVDPFSSEGRILDSEFIRCDNNATKVYENAYGIWDLCKNCDWKMYVGSNDISLSYSENRLKTKQEVDPEIIIFAERVGLLLGCIRNYAYTRSSIDFNGVLDLELEVRKLLENVRNKIRPLM